MKDVEFGEYGLEMCFFDIKDFDKIVPIFKIKNDLDENIVVIFYFINVFKKKVGANHNIYIWLPLFVHHQQQ